MGLPRYIATAGLSDPERMASMALDLADGAVAGSVCLVQCGRESPLATQVASALQHRGQRTRLLLIDDREQARSDQTLGSLEVACGAWVFADNLLAAFHTMFATPAAFVLRERAHAGLPVVGVGGGALAVGALMPAQRVCAESRYDLVTGLGWAPRVLFDADLWEDPGDKQVARDSVRTLPGLLGVQLGRSGAVRVEGGRVESVGDEPVVLLGMDCQTGLLQLKLQPEAAVRIAPPPFAPFERGLLPRATLDVLAAVEGARLARASAAPRQAPSPPEVAPDPAEHHERPGSGKKCPLCNQVHPDDAQVELAA
jgi:hypothetical protein